VSTELDLVVLVADADAEWTVRTLLEKRCESLGIRPVQAEVIRYKGRDPGTFSDAHDFLRVYLQRASYALVILDREGSGQDAISSADEMEVDIEERLRGNGWQKDEHGNPRAAAIVLDPELEIWVWSSSARVPAVLGLTKAELREVLADFPTAPNGKPKRPKEAMEAALHRSRKPNSPRIFQELAARVSLENAEERAFVKLRATLQGWFPPTEWSAP